MPFLCWLLLKEGFDTVLKFLGCLTVCCVFVGVAQAQLLNADNAYQPQMEDVFDEDVRTNRRTQNNAADVSAETGVEDIANSFVTGKNDNQASDNPLDLISKSMVVKETESQSDMDEAEEEIFIPEGELYRLNTPTTDGSARGGQAFVEVDDKGRMKKAEKIFLFYDEYKVAEYLSDNAVCDVRFNILSNLDQKISKLDIKLVWPDMTTSLSFSDVLPNTQTYYNYSLLGNGCYNMDKAPNIIVNRCRVKGMTSVECANKLVWLTK